MSPTPAEDRRLGRDLRLFTAYRFLSTAYLFVPVLVLFFQQRGLDFTQIALLNSVYALTAIVFEVPTGVLADRFGRKNAMIAGAVLMALGCLVDYGGTTFWNFALGEGLLALGLTLSSGADSAYLYDLLRDSGQVERYRALEGRATASKLVGSALALLIGGLVARHHLADTYAVSAVLCVVAAIVAAFLTERHASALPERISMWASMRSASRVVALRPGLRSAILFSVVTFTLLRMGLYLQPTWLTQAGLGVASIGGVLAALSMVAAVGAEGIEQVRRRLDERVLVAALPLAIGLAYLALTRVGWPIGLVFFAVHALANGVYSPLSKELLNREITDSNQRATVLSVESMARRLGFGAFAPLAGVLIDRQNLTAGLELTGLFGVIGALVLLATRWGARKNQLLPSLTPETDATKV